MRPIFLFLFFIASNALNAQLPFMPKNGGDTVAVEITTATKDTLSNDLAQLKNPEFWISMKDNVTNWFISEVPSIIFLTLVFIFLLRFTRYVIRRTKSFTSKRLKHNHTETEIEETEKHLETLAAVAISIIKIILWVINIAPLLASAGIVGLAVGFGAQELVRDFITGFFILLENQIRTGDIAIINNTTGKVEKIEMRTITLRDVSGVVHIFQNGKINSLSNMTKGWSAIVVPIGVAYKEDSDRVADILKSICEEMVKDIKLEEHLISYKYQGIDAFGASSVDHLVKLTTKSGEQWSMSREFRRRVKYRFDLEKIEIPFWGS